MDVLLAGCLGRVYIELKNKIHLCHQLPQFEMTIERLKQ